MREMQKKIAVYMQNKSLSIQNYKIFLNMMDKYEELNLANYVEGKEEKMIFGNTTLMVADGMTLKDGINKMNDGRKNCTLNTIWNMPNFAESGFNAFSGHSIYS